MCHKCSAVWLEPMCLCSTKCPFCPSIYLCGGFCSRDTLRGETWASASNPFCFSYSGEKRGKNALKANDPESMQPWRCTQEEKNAFLRNIKQLVNMQPHISLIITGKYQ